MLWIYFGHIFCLMISRWLAALLFAVSMACDIKRELKTKPRRVRRLDLLASNNQGKAKQDTKRAESICANETHKYQYKRSMWKTCNFAFFQYHWVNGNFIFATRRGSLQTASGTTVAANGKNYGVSCKYRVFNWICLHCTNRRERNAEMWKKVAEGVWSKRSREACCFCSKLEQLADDINRSDSFIFSSVHFGSIQYTSSQS